MSSDETLRDLRDKALERVGFATANLEAAKRAALDEPDSPPAIAWLESAIAEAVDARAVGQEMGLR